MNEEKIRDKIIELGPWFHQIQITDNLRTRDISPSPGPQSNDHPFDRWQILEQALPDDMQGMRVLDIGCADGFFSLQLAQRGADVVAIDYSTAMINRLNWVIEIKNIKNISTKVAKIEDIDIHEKYDAVFFLALLYHLKSPLLGLEILSKITSNLYLETVIHEEESMPYLYFKPPQEGVHVVPKWYPTTSCVIEMMKFAGFSNITTLHDPTPKREFFIATK